MDRRTERNPTGTLLELDSRRRLSLGQIAKHDRYLAEIEQDGTIVLTPAVVMTEAEARLLAAPETAREIAEFLKDPSTGVVWEGRRARRAIRQR
jgi:hypothetical protein